MAAGLQPTPARPTARGESHQDCRRSGGTRNRSVPLSRCRLLPRVDEGPGVCVDGGGELAEVECVCREGDAGGIVLRGEGQAGGGVLALEDESLAQDLVPPGIGSALEYWVDFEVGL